jgi:hypothetical protein
VEFVSAALDDQFREILSGPDRQLVHFVDYAVGLRLRLKVVLGQIAVCWRRFL